MYLLKKVIQLREHTHPDHEKPFLEHLEDLRTMITRVVVTLVIAMVACFAFNKELMDFFRYPVDQVLITQVRSTLPADAPVPISVEMWGKARELEHAVVNLTPEQRDAFYEALDNETLVFHAKSVGLLRATKVLPENKRAGFVDKLEVSDQQKEQIRSLLVTGPSTDGDITGNLRMMSALKPTEGFMLSMKVSFVAGIVVSFPLLLMFILQFVLPGLHQTEKKVLWPAMAVGFGLFLVGTAFAYYLVLPRALLFFAEWSGDMGISNDWRIGEYISFATQFTLLFGLSFELPVVVMVFVKLGLLSYETMSSTRSYAIVAIFIAAAILTPTPDAMTLALMAAPMIVLYELCIWLAYFDRKRNRQREETEARERVEKLLLAEEKRAALIAAGEPADYTDRDLTGPEDDLEDPLAWNGESVLKDAEDEAGDDGWKPEDEAPIHSPDDSADLADLDLTQPLSEDEDPLAWNGEPIITDTPDEVPGDADGPPEDKPTT